jgi:demethylmenaquinone methyltransferase/2-methoxy-6-polyprenyl-1,4-benzoquinol methylase
MALGEPVDLLVEQVEFYRAEAKDYDAYLARLLDPDNEDPGAVAFRVGQLRVAESLSRRAPLGRVLEIAAGPGMLSALIAPYADHLVLLDSSPESLALAQRRLAAHRGRVVCEDANVFEWESAGAVFDMVCFSSWLHHVPSSDFDRFWRIVDSVLVPGGQVFFDFPDRDLVSHAARDDVPDDPAEEYRFYRPDGGVSLRDYGGRRWRVVHLLWTGDELVSRLAELGWEMKIETPGWFPEFRWATARRSV